MRYRLRFFSGLSSELDRCTGLRLIENEWGIVKAKNEKLMDTSISLKIKLCRFKV